MYQIIQHKEETTFQTQEEMSIQIQEEEEDLFWENHMFQHMDEEDNDREISRDTYYSHIMIQEAEEARMWTEYDVES